jgi:hypothetical protein
MALNSETKTIGRAIPAVPGGGIAIDSAHRRISVTIGAALWNSERRRSFYLELSDYVVIGSVADRLRFLPATRCDISTELEFIASHFCDFLYSRNPLKAFSFSMISNSIGFRGLIPRAASMTSSVKSSKRTGAFLASWNVSYWNSARWM